MPRPRVSSNSRPYSTDKVGQDDPQCQSPDTASDMGWNGLSFLAGGVDTNDLDEPGSPYGMNYSFDSADYRRKRMLQRHMIEQGLSTFCFPDQD